MTGEAASFLFQLLIVSAVSLVVFACVKRKIGYRELVGLKNGGIDPRGLAACVATAAIYLAVQQFLLAGLIDPQPKYDLRSVSGVVMLLIWGFLRTALCEEILFRGIIRNGAAVFIGRWPANLLQAAGFAALHGLVFVRRGVPHDHLAQWTLLFLSVVAMSLLLAELNDRFGRGSIYPGWLVHGLGNVATQCVLTFLR